MISAVSRAVGRDRRERPYRVAAATAHQPADSRHHDRPASNILEPAFDIMNQPLVSIVIPTYARPERLRDCLVALARQTMPADTFEIIVVDDGSPQRVVPPEATTPSGPAIRIIRQPNAGRRPPATAASRKPAGNSSPSLTTTACPRQGGSSRSSPPTGRAPTRSWGASPSMA